MEKHRILVIEDNADTRLLLENILSKEFTVLTAENAVIGIDLARNRGPDLILLDIMLPILSGLDACNLLKNDESTKRIPILFLTAKNTSGDAVQGLNLGAEDYVSKPFDHRELIARIKARLRSLKDTSGGPIIAGDLRIDVVEREVKYGSKKIQLTTTEFDLLKYLVSKSGTIISREEILTHVWGENSPATNDRTIDVHIRSIRRKIPALTKYIISVYGVGYKFER